jgi:CheY-like chemotaxis protein
MSDTSHPAPARPGAPADRPLNGLSILVVEDSRFAFEAVRLLALRSGARVRRADSLAAAHRHLAIYRPTVVIADIGLPDGTGDELIAELARVAPRVPALIGMSGDPGAEAAAMAAGADGFLPKPVESLAEFQQVLIACLPQGTRPRGLRALPTEVVLPGPTALAEDLSHVADIIRDRASPIAYVAQFLGAVARSAHDLALEAAALRLAAAGGARSERARVAGLVADRIAGLRAG